MRKLPWILPVLALALAPLAHAAEPEYPPAVTVRCIRVIDGDTIKIRIGEGSEPENVRLIGINTPERGEPGYKEARAFVVRLCHDKDVRIEFDRVVRDRYKRLLGYIFAPGPDGGPDIFVNAELLKTGHAKYYGYFSTDRYDEILKNSFCEE